MARSWRHRKSVRILKIVPDLSLIHIYEEHLDVYNFKKKERKKEVQELSLIHIYKDGEILVKANHMITPKRAARIMSEGVDANGKPFEQIKIRTILNLSLIHILFLTKCTKTQ